MALEDAKNPLKGVSGPGKYAKRTDRMPSNFYGDQTQIADIASGATISKTPDVKAVPVEQAAAAAQAPVTSLYAPSTRPNEPITSGIDSGPGAGASALQMRTIPAKLSDSLVKMLPYDSTGEIAVLYQNALARGN
jgi:hypothetical protein